MIKKFTGLCLTLSVSLFADINKHELNQLNIDAMVVKDLNSKHILYAKEPLKELKPASLTKVMTALLAINSGKMNQYVTITREMTHVEPTIAGYKRGDVILLSDLVKAAMIQSDNDAAMAIAIAIGGDEKKFVAMMNAKARQIGLKHIHFTNPCGYDDKEHYSTTNDLLTLTEYAIKNSTFNAIGKLN